MRREGLCKPRRRCRSWVDLTGGSEFKILRALITGKGRESEIIVFASAHSPVPRVTSMTALLPSFARLISRVQVTTPVVFLCIP